MTIKGKYGEAEVFTEFVEPSAVAQIVELLNQPLAEDSHIRIMPDVHAGAGCVIGLTMRIKDKVIPNLVGVDIGCGVLSGVMPSPIMNFDYFNHRFERAIPVGFSKHDQYRSWKFPLVLRPSISGLPIDEVCKMTGQDADNVRRSLCTLGGGNHFAEIDFDGTDYWFTVHTGSRNFGLKIATHFQKIAQARHPEVNKDLAWLEGQDLQNYLWCVSVAQKFAECNRYAIMQEMIVADNQKMYHSVHNYIDFDSAVPVLRKGAVSAKKGERVIIPMNMRDGVVFGIGKGNEQWNCSAPHGAGRTMSRSAARKVLSVEEFKEQMAGVFSTCVSEDTLDESPMAYKPMNDVLGRIGETIDIQFIAKPLWNYKAQKGD